MRAVSLNLPDRALRLGRLVGTVEKHGDVVSITNTGLDLARSHLRVDGNVRGVPRRPTLEFKVSSGAFAFDEMARLIPGVPSRPVQAAFSATVRGPVSKLATTIAFRSPAGDAVGDVVVGREGDDPTPPARVPRHARSRATSIPASGRTRPPSPAASTGTPSSRSRRRSPAAACRRAARSR